MDKNKTKQIKKTRRHQRVRGRVFGTAERPRLVAYKSNTSLEMQLVDDSQGRTLAAAHTRELKKSKSNKTEQAAEIGKLIAAKAQKAKVKQAVFDKGGSKYHGRVKAAADAAREGGLEF